MYVKYSIVFKLSVVYIGLKADVSLFPCIIDTLDHYYTLLNVLLDYYKEVVESRLLMVAVYGLIL